MCQLGHFLDNYWLLPLSRNPLRKLLETHRPVKRSPIRLRGLHSNIVLICHYINRKNNVIYYWISGKFKSHLNSNMNLLQYVVLHACLQVQLMKGNNRILFSWHSEGNSPPNRCCPQSRWCREEHRRLAASKWNLVREERPRHSRAHQTHNTASALLRWKGHQYAFQFCFAHKHHILGMKNTWCKSLLSLSVVLCLQVLTQLMMIQRLK